MNLTLTDSQNSSESSTPIASSESASEGPTEMSNWEESQVGLNSNIDELTFNIAKYILGVGGTLAECVTARDSMSY